MAGDRILRDWQGLAIRLTAERLDHIREHPEMTGMESAIEATLSAPEEVLQSLSDLQARLYYRFYVGTMVGDKYVCVVVKIVEQDAFVLTAYLTDKVKKGNRIWPRSS
jgi:hypothetical protein